MIECSVSHRLPFVGKVSGVSDCIVSVIVSSMSYCDEDCFSARDFDLHLGDSSPRSPFVNLRSFD